MADHAKKEVFVEGGSFYDNVKAQVEAVVEGEPDFIANVSNISAILFEHLNKKKNNTINWAGFYFWKKDQLVLGPFQGKVACIRIPLGKGVCGTSAQKRETILVPDVHLFPGHIACDSASNSEIVVPILSTNKEHLIGVLDIDCLVTNGFDEEDKKGLEDIAAIVSRVHETQQ
eukprot:TRINITY_DN5158_c0_g1_i1.p1 TRINITY_DN5158_c0_g1~~TRINITY_DN5158_c0_g1_i1.p1  ORF type:complete len:173 (+),score=38.64 TRINITY_DN5158_c0_g1_i1:25-543(+)